MAKDLLLFPSADAHTQETQNVLLGESTTVPIYLQNIAIWAPAQVTGMRSRALAVSVKRQEETSGQV